MKQLTNRCAAVLPYHIDERGDCHLVLERKSADYKAPFFDNAFTLIGGFATAHDKTPRNLIEREIAEEYWQIHDPEESLNDLLDQEFIKENKHVISSYDPVSISTLQHLGRLISGEMEPVGNYVIAANPPVAKDPILLSLHLFGNELNASQFREARDIIREYDGRVTPDTLKFGSAIECISLADINRFNRKFAWGQDAVVTDLTKRNIFNSELGVYRMFGRLEDSLEKPYPVTVMPLSMSGEPQFSDLEQFGFSYKK